MACWLSYPSNADLSICTSSFSVEFFVDPFRGESEPSLCLKLVFRLGYWPIARVGDTFCWLYCAAEKPRFPPDSGDFWLVLGKA